MTVTFESICCVCNILMKTTGVEKTRLSEFQISFAESHGSIQTHGYCKVCLQELIDEMEEKKTNEAL